VDGEMGRWGRWGGGEMGGWGRWGDGFTEHDLPDT